MDLERLQIFLHIVDSGSVSAAAPRAHLSQPAVSRNLQQLEESLGVELFTRVGRGLELTAAGRMLVPRARSLLDEAEGVRREIEHTAERRYFDLRLGTVDSVCTFLLPDVIAPLREAWPELQVKLTTARSAQLLRRLAAHELDAIILAWSGPPPAEPARRADRYRLGFYGRKEHFAPLRRVREEAELAAFPIVQIEPLPGQPTLVDEDAPSWALAGSLASVKALVMAGFGVGALLDFMLEPQEAEQLARARVPHDPDCALWVVSAAGRDSEVASAIDDTLCRSLRRALRARRQQTR